MPFGLNNGPAIFSCIVIAAFKDFIHKFLEVYFDNWTVFGLVKHRVEILRLMLDTCQRYQVALNLNKCLFCVPFEILLGHVVCRHGLMVDPCEDRGDNQLGGTKECEIVARNSKA